MLTCIVCKEETDKFDNDFKAGFCASDDCTEQLVFGWGSLQNARIFFKALYVRPDGQTSETPLNWLQGVKAAPAMFTHVRAARYDK